MNWTEGNLSRHSRGRQRNELLTRQRQHFAKARNSLLKDGIKQSPISISFLGTQHTRVSRRREESGDGPSRLPSSPNPLEKRKWTQDPQDGIESQVSNHEKRRRLLDKSDWVGLDLQQPIDIAFPRQFQASTGSRWGKADRSRVHMAFARHEPVDARRLEESQEIHAHPLRIQIGSREMQPRVSTVSQSSTKRYSLAPRPLANSSQRRSNSISSPVPSQARQLYVSGRSSQTLLVKGGGRHGLARERSNIYFKGPVKPPVQDEPAHVVYSSSVIHEPIPRRANDFTVLQWSPSRSEDRGSLQVETDHPLRSVPPSQKADQALWESWLVSSSDNLSNHYSISPLAAIQSTSSRTSALPSHLQRRLPSYEVSSEPSMSTLEGTQVPVNEDKRQSPTQNSNHQAEVQSTDDNGAWMKFVFDGDSDELEAKAFAEAAHQTARELYPSETATSVTEVIETVATCGTDPWTSDEREQDESISPRTSNENHMSTHATIASESAPSNIATAGSASVVESEPRFRFALPKTFVGKLAAVNSGVMAQGPPLLPQRGRKCRGRPKKRAADGRADIRRLPDFDEDPIEEFEDE
ncbi:hypothetical protein AAE478_006409 [Parahypoxylon ruwenzoriense]